MLIEEYIRSGIRHNYYVRLENLATELSSLIRDTKTKYHSKLAAKLVNPSTSPKHTGQFWKLSPLLGKLQCYLHYWITMNLFLTLRLNLIISTDPLTNNVKHFPSSVNLATNESQTNINFDEQLISKLVLTLNLLQKNLRKTKRLYTNNQKCKKSQCKWLKMQKVSMQMIKNAKILNAND